MMSHINILNIWIAIAIPINEQINIPDSLTL